MVWCICGFYLKWSGVFVNFILQREREKKIYKKKIILWNKTYSFCETGELFFLKNHGGHGYTYLHFNSNFWKNENFNTRIFCSPKNKIVHPSVRPSVLVAVDGSSNFKSGSHQNIKKLHTILWLWIEPILTLFPLNFAQLYLWYLIEI